MNRLFSGFLGAFGLLLLALPAEAARLQFWRFDAEQNQLVFTTDTRVQPRAQLLLNPTRIIIDLPETSLDQATVNESVGGAVREIRVGQFDDQTTRLVIELNPGYVLDPQQIEVRGTIANRWTVQLPNPEWVGAPPPTIPAPPSSAPPPDANSVSSQAAMGDAATQLEKIVATADGFFIRTAGAPPEIEVERLGEESKDNRQIILTLADTSIAPGLTPQNLPNQRYSVRNWQITQSEDTPSATQVTLNLGDGSPDWRTVVSGASGVVLLPEKGVSINSIPDIPEAAPTEPAEPQPVPTAPIPSPPAQQNRPTLASLTRPRPQPPSVAATQQRPTQRVVVVIDPGHGGVDPGTIGIGGLREIDIVLPIALQVASLLEAQGVQVIMTRREDRTLELQPRVDIAENANANLFVSIHANAINLSRPDVNGLESYYYSNNGRQLAEVIHQNMLSATGMRNRGLKRSRFYVLRNTSMPATLLEVGYVTGVEDAPRLADPQWRTMMANAIARGILQYIYQNF
ncbi:MAG: N-acetylmuramoyl-L-alanine amidase [Leptolyngbyaceae cyanobacterium MO_188.B28]|nr:N-acetylmuramoyl-L-alanine amidase [Leptolyngbyaceae cyanobacterium MO_188.B28]